MTGDLTETGINQIVTSPHGGEQSNHNRKTPERGHS